MSGTDQTTRLDEAPTTATTDEQSRIVSLLGDVSHALVLGSTMVVMLQACAEAIVRHLDAAVVRIWTLDESEGVLELRASAGMSGDPEGPHGRIAVDALEIGLIVQERAPHVTSRVSDDLHAADQEWARREGLVAFAGYPLVVEDRLIGVAALFARHELSTRELSVLAVIADLIALGIQRVTAREALQARATSESQSRRRAEAGQQRASVLVQEATRIQSLKDEFFAAAAHDLKNPLAGIQGTAELLLRRIELDSPLDEARLRRGLEQITTASKRMTGLIDQLMDLAHLHLGHALDLSRHETDLVTLIARCVAEQQTLSEEHEITLRSDVPALVGLWDAERLERVLTNLVSNAVKYSPDGGVVAVTLHRQSDGENDRALVVVQDRGMGIPSLELPLVFDRFFRATNVPEEIHGTGLGLSVSRHIVEQHGGSIRVESPPDGGTRFVMSLPVR